MKLIIEGPSDTASTASTASTATTATTTWHHDDQLVLEVQVDPTNTTRHSCSTPGCPYPARNKGGNKWGKYCQTCHVRRRGRPTGSDGNAVLFIG